MLLPLDSIFPLHLQFDDRDTDSKCLLFNTEYTQSSLSCLKVHFFCSEVSFSPRTTHIGCWHFSLNRIGSTRTPFVAMSISVCLSLCLTSSLLPYLLHCLCEGSLDMEPMILHDCCLISSVNQTVIENLSL